MAILFAGNEDIEFEIFGPVGVSTNDVFNFPYRTSHVRSCLTMSAPSSGPTSGAYIAASVTPQPTLWVSAWAAKINVCTGNAFVQFYDRSVRTAGPVLALTGAADGSLSLVAYDASGAATTRAKTAAGVYPSVAPIDKILTRFDILVDLAGNQAKIYLGSRLILTYQGPLATSGSTALDRVVLSNPGSGAGNGITFSEVIIATTSTLLASVYSLYPQVVSGPWTGGASAINETLLDTTGFITSNTANAVATITANTLPAGANIPVATIRLSEASTGDAQSPDTVNLGVLASGATFYGPDHPLANGVITNATVYANTNPATATAWNVSQINSLNILLKVSNTSVSYVMTGDGSTLVGGDGTPIIFG